jgi:ubiquinol-cytochrome c reductase iron-sulfur subunit
VSRLRLLALVLLGLWRRPPRGERDRERIVEAAPPDRPAETAAAMLLLLVALCATAFIFFYVTSSIPNQTQWLGLSLGGAFLLLAAALILVGRRLVPTEHLTEEYPAAEHEDEQARVAQIVEESGTRFTRKGLMKASAGAAATALGLALVTPAISLGPGADTSELLETPWRRGKRLIDQRGNPLRADEIEQGTFYTAFPEGGPRDVIGAPVVVVRLDPAALRLPPERRDWAPGGILAYSKVCTHAGCAIALYRKPTFPPVQPKPALVCPCHYSTFDPARGGAVIFGPAGRGLPQLPLVVDARGELRAGGNFSGPVGPSWWGVRSGKPRST